MWLHEIKHDGYRIIACKSGGQVRLWSRNGRDWSREFLAVTQALAALPLEDIVLDGEACAHCPDGLPDFHGLRSDSGGASVSVRFRPSPGGRARPPANALGGAPGALADAVLASCRAPRGRRGGNLPHACAL
jgi:bifunctional non-homologous end joining protein LigD